MQNPIRVPAYNPGTPGRGADAVLWLVVPEGIYLILTAFLIGVTAGLRSFTPLAAVSWGARLGWLHLENTPLAFLGFAATPYIFSLLALAELVNDKLPKTPSRKAAGPFGARIVTGALSGAALGASAGSIVLGTIGGLAGGIAGTLGGYEFRMRLVKATGGNDLPIALLEDAIAVGASFLIAANAS